MALPILFSTLERHRRCTALLGSCRADPAVNSTCLDYLTSSARFPGQENAAGDSKIPSILYYNLDGSVRAVGAEAALPHLALDAEDEGLLFIEWYVLFHFQS